MRLNEIIEYKKQAELDYIEKTKKIDFDRIIKRIKETKWSYIIEENLHIETKKKLHEIGYVIIETTDNPNVTIIRGW